MMGAYDRVTYELTIFRVSHDDYGEYTCHARTNIGTGDPASVVLYGELSNIHEAKLYSQ